MLKCSELQPFQRSNARRAGFLVRKFVLPLVVPRTCTMSP